MPIYEYQCRRCDYKESLLESYDAAQTKKCPSCRKKTFIRLVSAAAFHLKGGGWYVTDFKGKKPGAQKSEKDGDGGDKKPPDVADKKAATDKTVDKKTASEKKPAKSDGDKPAAKSGDKN